MNEIDKKIKKTFQLRSEKIEDKIFTQNIINTILENRRSANIRPFLNFLPIIIGLSSFIFSIGIVVLVLQNYEWLNEFGVTLHHGIIISIISLIFLLHKLMDEVTFSKSISSNL